MRMKAVVAKIALCVVACLALACALPACARQGAGVAGSAATPSPTPTPDSSASATPTPLADLKTAAEIKKLSEELASLQIANRWMTALITAVGGVVLTALALFVGYTLNRTQKRKLVQDKRLGREEHLLKVFRDLGDERPRVRVGAVAVLVQRLTDLTKKRRAAACRPPLRWWRTVRLDAEEQKEAPTIVSVLISVSKHERNVDIQKYLADGIAKGLFAILDPKQSEKKKATPPVPPSGKESPLRAYDFQRAQFQNAWWYSIDARGVDFYKANLRRAGLRRALLSNAILKNADLSEAVLVGADLSGADLSGADLTGAKLDGANVYKTKFAKANVEGVDFGGVLNLHEADLSGAVGYLPPVESPPDVTSPP